MLIGRKKEQEELKKAFYSEYSQFVVVYGRRRIGKTFLVRETFGNNFTFQHTGVARKSTREQLKFFKESLIRYGMKKVRVPKDWADAFSLLEQLINQSNDEKKIIFIDEIPWMDSPKSGFVTALEYFWNAYASARKDIVLIICGSATSWIINKVLKNHGGLHNRVQRRIKLLPFTLHECEQYALSLGINHSRYDILEYYMALGGVAYYWSLLEKGLSVAQNIDNLFFAPTGQLHNEFNELYDSLFENPEPYFSIINALGTIKAGMTREEIVKQSGIASGGNLSRMLEDLEECGFIRRYNSFGKSKNDCLYQLIDCFTLFYYKFMKNNTNADEHFWSHSYESSTRYSWVGLAFERVCFQHIEQIKHALGISGVVTQTFSWSTKDDDVFGAGVQIDMLIDRADNVVNICEMKFSKNPFVISKDYVVALQHKIDRFRQVTETRKTLFITMLTPTGLAHNNYWSIVQNELTADDLFLE